MRNESEQDDDPIVIIEKGIASGEIDRDQVNHARAHWEGQLRDGVVMPNGERVIITERILYHVLVREPRIRRKPERIERLLSSVFEVCTAHSGRRAALGEWQEGASMIYGYAILEADSSLRTAHIGDAKKLRKLARQGDLLWNQEQYPSFGTAPSETS